MTLRPHGAANPCSAPLSAPQNGASVVEAESLLQSPLFTLDFCQPTTYNVNVWLAEADVPVEQDAIVRHDSAGHMPFAYLY